MVLFFFFTILLFCAGRAKKQQIHSWNLLRSIKKLLQPAKQTTAWRLLLAGWLAGWAPENERRWLIKAMLQKKKIASNHWPAKWSFIVVKAGKRKTQRTTLLPFCLFKSKLLFFFKVTRSFTAHTADTWGGGGGEGRGWEGLLQRPSLRPTGG